MSDSRSAVFESEALNDYIRERDKRDQEHEEKRRTCEKRKEALPAVTFDDAMQRLMQLMKEVRLTEHERECLVNVNKLWLFGKR